MTKTEAQIIETLNKARSHTCTYDMSYNSRSRTSNGRRVFAAVNKLIKKGLVEQIGETDKFVEYNNGYSTTTTYITIRLVK